MSGDAASVILQPGQRIKPNVSENQAKQLIQQHYGLRVTKLKELNSYDDNNYYVEAVHPDGKSQKFIFKVLNFIDSKKPGHVEAESECMLYLRKRGINCPIPVMNLKGESFVFISTQPGKTDVENNDTSTNSDSNPVNLIRLLEFIEGKLLYDIPLTRKLLVETGAYVAELANLLKGFQHEALKSHKGTWVLSSVPHILDFVYVFKDQPEKFKMAHDVVRAFKADVEPAYATLEKAIVHGDINEQNFLLVPENENSKEYKVHGIIDFGDLQDTYHLFELAISLCYLMIQSIHAGIDPLEGSALLLTGYTKHRKIPELELKLLRTCIAGRLCQSLVIGAYSYSQDPGNEYLLTTASVGWDLLKRIWSDTTEEQLRSIWKL